MESMLVWAPDPAECYVLGRVVDIGFPDIATVQPVPVASSQKSAHKSAPVANSSQPVKCPISQVLPSEIDLNKDYDDNCSLMYLNEANLLHNIRLRYFQNKIYTYVANILIALNPYHDLGDKLYSSNVLRSYQGKSLGKMPPHVFAIADKAYHDLKRMSQSQSVIVSGESGAGKTESTKYILRYLCESFGGAQAGDAIQIEQLILEANPLLEAFGNATTARNNNSSRFGKFIEIFFNDKFMVAGSHIAHYLLEKSRICGQITGSERSYHIFYQLCVGLPTDQWTKLKLGPPDKFAYLRNGSTRYFLTPEQDRQLDNGRKSKQHQQEGYLSDSIVNDLGEFCAMDKAFDHFGVSKEDKFAIYQIVAAILHLGNIGFEESPNDSRGGCRVKPDPESQEALQNAAQLLGVDVTQLQQCLQTRMMQTNKGGYKGSIYMVPLKVHEAQNARDALAKAIYSNLFDHIVSKVVNKALPTKQASVHHSIGVLDIAGFEYFETNSFEQFCINYCNEKLQHFFNERILHDEQALYESEGLGVRRIDYVDNQDCIELFEAKGGGIFDLLDEESRLPKPLPQHFTEMVHSTNRGKFRLDIPRKSKLRVHRELRDDEGFIIRHFAGAVCYQTTQFIEKNNNTLHTNLAFLMIESNTSLLPDLFKNTGTGGQRSSPNFVSSSSMADKSVRLSSESVGSKFRKQLAGLIQRLQSTGTHFVRCIKPNLSMVPHTFEATCILSQLKCSGMGSVLQLMQYGYPSRATYTQIRDLYSPHLPERLAKLEPRFFCQALIKSVGLKEGTDVCFGVTKVFFRPGRFAEFDMLLKNDDPGMLEQLVKKVQHWMIASRWKRAQWTVYSTIKLKNKIAYRRALIICIQKNIRMFLAHKRYKSHFRALADIKQLNVHLDQIPLLIAKIQTQTEKQTYEQKLNLLRESIKQIPSQTMVPNSDPPIMDRSKVDVILTKIRAEFDQLLNQLQTALNEQELRVKRLLEEELENERRKREEEEANKRRQEELKRKKEELEKRKRAEMEQLEQQKKQQEEQQSSLVFISEEEREHNVQLMKRYEQENRDRELAIRLSMEDGAVVAGHDDTPASKPLLNLNNLPVSRKYNMETWSYADLRDTINNSVDIELLEACREEFHRRLKVYHSWKHRSKQYVNHSGVGHQDDPSRAPPNVMETYYNLDLFEKNVIGDMSTSTSSIPAEPTSNGRQHEQRYFRMPLNRPGEPRAYWYAHFDGRWISRQMEIRPSQEPILLVAGRDDLAMCELSLEETGLTRKPGIEILQEEFEREWHRHGGNQPIKQTKQHGVNSLK